nr:EOG090X0AVI [Triops cancriformis]
MAGEQVVKVEFVLDENVEQLVFIRDIRSKTLGTTPSARSRSSNVVERLSNVQATPEHVTTTRSGRTPRSAALKAKKKLALEENAPFEEEQTRLEEFQEEASNGITMIDDLALQNGEYMPGVLTEMAQGAGDVFGFQTPRRKDRLSQKVKEVIDSLKTPTSSAKKAMPRTPKTPKTPKSSAKKTIVAETPHGLRNRLRKKIAVMTEEVLSDISTDEGSEYQPTSESEDEDEKDTATPLKEESIHKLSINQRRKRKVNDEDEVINTETYFEAHAASTHTSDHTLKRLRTPRLSQEAMEALLQQENHTKHHQKQLSELLEDSKCLFSKWELLLREGFNVLLYGMGSKRDIIHQFHTQLLAKEDVIVINGFFPGLTLKELLSTIAEDLLECTSTTSNIPVQLDLISQALAENERKLYLLIHNIDGPSLQNEKAQDCLSRLATIDGIHIVASIDHINAPILWDATKASRFRFLHFDATTFGPYVEETSFENSILDQQSSTLALSSLVHVFASLTPNAKGIFMLISKHQLEQEDSNYAGYAFQDLYRACLDAFLVNSDLTLRAQLTEFVDHKLIRIKRGVDGAEMLVIPLEAQTLKEFIAQQSEETA